MRATIPEACRVPTGVTLSFELQGMPAKTKRLLVDLLERLCKEQVLSEHSCSSTVIDRPAEGASIVRVREIASTSIVIKFG